MRNGIITTSSNSEELASHTITRSTSRTLQPASRVLLFNIASTTGMESCHGPAHDQADKSG
eukprot:12898196-Prorocentrum_lima.AAC.1